MTRQLLAVEKAILVSLPSVPLLSEWTMTIRRSISSEALDLIHRHKRIGTACIHIQNFEGHVLSLIRCLALPRQ